MAVMMGAFSTPVGPLRLEERVGRQTVSVSVVNRYGFGLCDVRGAAICVVMDPNGMVLWEPPLTPELRRELGPTTWVVVNSVGRDRLAVSAGKVLWVPVLGGQATLVVCVAPVVLEDEIAMIWARSVVAAVGFRYEYVVFAPPQGTAELMLAGVEMAVRSLYRDCRDGDKYYRVLFLVETSADLRALANRVRDVNAGMRKSGVVAGTRPRSNSL